MMCSVISALKLGSPILGTLVCLSPESAKVRIIDECVAYFLSMFYRQYEQREMRYAHERQRQRDEFVKQQQKIENQLEYERTRDTEGMSNQ